MNIYTIGFTQKSARQFFGLLDSYSISTIIDIRLNNKSQLAGFTKGDDLNYFLDVICGCNYQHRIEFAPSKDIFDNYKKKIIDWGEYARQYNSLMNSRKAVQTFMNEFSQLDNICLLCSEPTPERCHRRLFAEMIVASHPEICVIHI